MMMDNNYRRKCLLSESHSPGSLNALTPENARISLVVPLDDNHHKFHTLYAAHPCIQRVLHVLNFCLPKSSPRGYCILNEDAST